MELPFRTAGDELLPAGALRALRQRLRPLVARRSLSAVVAYAFDGRTRMLPFVFIDRRMAPGGPRAVTAGLVDVGVARTRTVLQQWNPRFDPARMALDGQVPDLFLVSGMGIHGRPMDHLIRRACRIDGARRPLVIAGGPRTNYEPWRVFGTDPRDPWGADVASTGELPVLLSLLEVLLEERGERETLRQTFLRCRDRGWLDHLPGLVYAKGAQEGVAEELVDTGVQRLLQDLDELPDPVLGFSCLEPPSSRPTLAARPLSRTEVRRHSPVASIEMTYGCKFRCPYCPIPAYNQHKDRQKSPERLVQEFRTLRETYGISWFFGTDDNFFNRKERTLEIVEALARASSSDGTPLRKRIRWATEVTVHDAYGMREHLGLVRAAGVRALWLGVEDMTATLVKKGQSVDRTRAVFQALRDARIMPMPMLVHDDGQPLLTFASARGLLNQAQLLRGAGAMTLQVLYLGPAHGSKLYNETYETGLAYASVAGHDLDESMLGGNYVVASRHPRPWLRQANGLIAYLFFYNPLRFLKALVRPKTKRYALYDAFCQGFGMMGLLWNLKHVPWWLAKLVRGPVVRATAPPRPALPVRSPAGGLGAHDLPPGPDPKKDRRLETLPYDVTESVGRGRRRPSETIIEGGATGASPRRGARATV